MSQQSLKHIDVAAALIFREHRLLVCQRGAGGSFPLKWEFPGGKVEQGESFEAALRRELKEELGIEIEEATEMFACQHTYPAICRVSLKFFEVHSFKGSVSNRIFQTVDWVAVSELPKLDFLAADLPLIHKLTGQR
jgi:8-oxo-dGTP diphosphatase